MPHRPQYNSFDTLAAAQANLIEYVEDWWNLYKRPITYRQLQPRYSCALRGSGISFIRMLLKPELQRRVQCVLMGGVRVFFPKAVWESLGAEGQMLYLSKAKRETAKQRRARLGAGTLPDSQKTTLTPFRNVSMADILKEEEPK